MSSRSLYIGLIVSFMMLACEPESRSPALPNFFPAPSLIDAGSDDVDERVDTPPFLVPPPDNICNANAVRCRASYTELIEICEIPENSSVPVRRWVPSRCSEGNVCIDNACVPFECVPERTTCLGLDITGVCNEEGDALEDPIVCPEDTVCRGGSCVDLCEVARLGRSYIGCEYMVAELPNPLLELNEPFGIVVANIDPVLEARVSVLDFALRPEALIREQVVERTESLDGEVNRVTVQSQITSSTGMITPIAQDTADGIVIPPQGVATLLFARQNVPSSASGIHNTPRRLSASRPVVAYQFNPYCCNFSYTNDATLLLPIFALGDSYTALVPPDWIVPNNGSNTIVFNGSLALLAHEDETQLQFTFPEQTTLRKTRLAPSEDRDLVLPNLENGQRGWNVTLQAGQMLYVESDTRPNQRSWLTGTRVEGNKTFAAFASHTCTFIPHGLAACDHLEAQLIPDETWGRRFILPPFARRSLASSEVMYWHFLAGSEGAQIQLAESLDLSVTLAPFSVGEQDCVAKLDREATRRTITLEPNSDCILGTKDSVVATSSHPISVLGYIAGEKASESPCGDAPYCNSGDPAMFLLPPIEQYRNAYVFLAPETYMFDFAAVIVPSQAATTMTLDGKPLDLSADDVDVISAPGSPFLIANVPISDGAHRLEAGAPFGVLIYAYDQYVSYAYPGGLNLTKRP